MWPADEYVMVSLATGVRERAGLRARVSPDDSEGRVTPGRKSRSEAITSVGSPQILLPFCVEFGRPPQ
jgi:hypothetical protein